MGIYKKVSSMILVIPTQEVAEECTQALEEIDFLEIDIRELLVIALETWVDLRGFRRKGYIYPFSYYNVSRDFALQERIHDDIVQPQINYEHLSEKHLNSLVELLSEVCLYGYSKIDELLGKSGIAFEGITFIHRIRWFNDDIVIRIDNIR